MTNGAGGLIDTAERAWAWVLDQVRWDDVGPWIPETVPMHGGQLEPDGEVRDTFYDGIGGLAPALLEVPASRPWSPRETELAQAIVTRLKAACQTTGESCLYSGVAGYLTALTLLDASGVQPALDRLAALRTADGWPPTSAGCDAVINDVVL